MFRAVGMWLPGGRIGCTMGRTVFGCTAVQNPRTGESYRWGRVVADRGRKEKRRKRNKKQEEDGEKYQRSAACTQGQYPVIRRQVGPNQFQGLARVLIEIIYTITCFPHVDSSTWFDSVQYAHGLQKSAKLGYALNVLYNRRLPLLTSIPTARRFSSGPERLVN